MEEFINIRGWLEGEFEKIILTIADIEESIERYKCRTDLMSRKKNYMLQYLGRWRYPLDQKVTQINDNECLFYSAEIVASLLSDLKSEFQILVKKQPQVNGVFYVDIHSHSARLRWQITDGVWQENYRHDGWEYQCDID